MDVQQPASIARSRRRRRVAWAAAVVVGIAAVTLALSRLVPAAPEVDRATIWTDTVKRGLMVRNVRGLGTLTPEDIRWIPAVTAGRVEQICVRPGTSVTPATIVLELSNPAVVQALADAESDLRAARAELTSLRARIENDLAAQEVTAVTTESEFKQASLQAKADGELAREGLRSVLDAQLSATRAEALGARAAAERKRLARMAGSVEAQLAVQQAAVERLQRTVGLRRSEADALHVKAGVDGVLQLVPVDVGQQVTQGTNLARVANPDRLKAELRIPENQAKDIQVGLTASVDTRNGLAAGRVSRIDPGVQGGTVTVDVAFDGALPRGARPDLSVDGTIEIERLANVLYVGRPALGQEQGAITLFRVRPGGTFAERVKVLLGRAAVSSIEVRSGLKEGDQVVLSDMSAWDGVDRLRLK